MRLGLFTSMGSIDWQTIVSLWQEIEHEGWDVACVTDHFMPNTATREGPVNEAWTTLSALAPLVPRMQIGTIVLGNTYRHPAVVAKMAAQLDIISGGRLLLGMGGGWQLNEHQAYGIPFETIAKRLARLDEACEVMRQLWTNERSHFAGKYYQLDDAPLDPKPVSQPYPELMIGGGGERVTLRIAARHADHWNVWGGPRTLAHKGRIFDEHCEALGRDPTELRRSANMALLLDDDPAKTRALVDTVVKRMGRTPEAALDQCLSGSDTEVVDTLGRLAEAGVDTLFVPTLFRRLEALRDDLGRLARDIVPQLA